MKNRNSNQAFRTSLTCDDFVPVDELIPDEIETVSVNTKYKYFNIPCAFDIETSSFRSTVKNEKVGIMYAWAFGMNGKVSVGRTWEEFTGLIDTLTLALNVSPERRLIVYVHNLAYEFQFMQKLFRWEKVFAVESRKPVYALTETGIEFRCSYLLSGYSLEVLGRNLQTYHVEKKTGDLDYTKIRHSGTPLTETEWGYIGNDVLVVMAYIMERIEADGSIARIPLTKTGYVRNYCRRSCFYGGDDEFKRLRYRAMMKGLRLTASEYTALKQAFQGGFTHANPFSVNRVLYDVTSYDFTSSYPAVMVAEKFPMSSGEVYVPVDRKDFDKCLSLYCCLFEIEFTGLESVLYQDSYISLSRCRSVVGAVVNNGRIVSAEHIITTITEQDFFIIQRFYSWKEMKIGKFRRYRRGYLPTDFVKAILKLYGDKTTLKGVSGKEAEYLNAKEMLNSCYGMTVTDIVREEHTFTNRWLLPEEIERKDIEKEMTKYNNSSSRFLFYPWGVWVTAYARRNLFTAIVECGTDYVYSDTDSVKIVNADKHKDYFDRYNRMITDRLKTALAFHGIEENAICPETIQGKKKPLGVWDFDGHYTRFKTLGAKRYLVEYADTGEVEMTVAGLNKKTAVPYMLSKWGKDGTFDHFSNGLYIPPGKTGKMTHTYIDDERTGTVTDYTGTPGAYREQTAAHLENAEYSLSLSREYVDYFTGLIWE